MNPRISVTGFFFCEKLLQEVDGVASAIRIVDTIAIPELQQPTAPPNIYPTVLVVNLKGDDYKGVCRVQVKARRPSGKSMKDSPEMAAEFEGGMRGVLISLQTNLAFPEEGVYWFELFIDGQAVTKTPLSVVLAPQTNATSENAQQHPANSPLPKES